MIGDCTGKLLDHEMLFVKGVFPLTFTRSVYTGHSRERLVTVYPRVVLPALRKDSIDFVFNRDRVTLVFNSVKDTSFNVFHKPNYIREG